MNHVIFMASVDLCISSMTNEQLYLCIHELARTLPEEMRDDFLSVLREVGKPAVKEVRQEGKLAEELKDELSEAEKLVADIRDRKLTIVQNINEEWDDWYGFLQDEFIFKDPDGLMKKVTKVIRLIHRFVDAGEYEPVLNLGMDLLDTKISTRGDYTKDSLDLGSAYKHLDMDFTSDLKKLALETMLCAYRCSPSPQQDIYRILVSTTLYRVPDLCLRLEDLLKFSPTELENQPAFFSAWADYLGERTENKSKILYEEALSFLQPKERMEKVKAHAGTHPEGYLLLLKDTKIPVRKRFQLGMDGLDRLKINCPDRTDIALETAELSLRSSQSADVTESCWLQAFASSPTPTGYLRVLLNCRDQKSRKEEMEKLYADYCASQANPAGRMNSNDLGLRFLRGNVMEFFRTFLEPGDYLRLTDTFVQEGIALYLALLYRGSTPTSSILAMMETGRKGLDFNSDTYRHGLSSSGSGDDCCEFPAVFEAWKGSIVFPDSAGTEEILDSVENSLWIMVDAICAQNRRSAYGECADFVGALGDVRESLGQTGAKQACVSAFANKYSARSRLLSEFRRVGWEGWKK